MTIGLSDAKALVEVIVQRDNTDKVIPDGSTLPPVASLVVESQRIKYTICRVEIVKGSRRSVSS